MVSRRTSYRKLAGKIKADQVLRLRRGVYVSPQSLGGLEGDFYRASLICGRPSVICLFSALQYHGLSEQMFGGVWILIPYSSTPPKSKFIRAIRSRSPFFRTGIKTEQKFRITNIERTIVDAFRYSRHVGIATAVHALKSAIIEKMTTKEKVYLMAKKLNAEKKILPYLESI